MNILTKKLRNGFEMPVFGLGTWEMGGRFEHDRNSDDESDIRAIKASINMGITHIDTAEIYAQGQAEKIVGEAIRGYERSKLFIVSKVAAVHLKYDDVLKSVEESLKRLKTDYLDLYLIHAPNPAIPIAETMRAMDALVDRGIIKNIGVSNFKKERQKEAQTHSKNKIVATQVHYNLIYREPEFTSLLKYCQQEDVILIAWRPVQKGLLTDKGNKILDEVSDKYKKTPAQVAINWLISQDHVITLSKMSHMEHIKENLGALDWQMEKDDLEKIRKDFPGQQEISDVVPLN